MLRGVDRLTYMTRYFDVVEMNSTFYAPADAAKVEGWIAKTAHAPDFRFAVKLWQRFTHERETAWTRADERDVRVALEPLHAAGKLGAVLVQFPWSFKRTEENRTWLGDIVSAFREFPLVVEIRHESWNVPHFYESLAESGRGVRQHRPAVVQEEHQAECRGHVANRLRARTWAQLQGMVSRERERAGAVRLSLLAGRARALGLARRADRGSARMTSTCSRTTTISGRPGVNALQLKSMVEHRKVAAPPQLFASYGEALAPYAEPR